MKTNIQKILITFGLACFLISCGKDEVSPVPYMIVDLNLLIASYPDLSAGNPVKITNPACGYEKHGIIVAPYGSMYYAYDATCTKDISHRSLSVDYNYTATCPDCKTVYNILGANNGFPKDGKGTRLKQYRAYSTNNNTRIIIRN